MKRREFLVGAAAAFSLAHGRRGLAQARDAAKLNRVAIMSLCFNSILKTPGADAAGRTLEIMDLGQMLADKYGVHNVEMQHAHFPSTDAKSLKDFRDRLAASKSRVTNINLEFGPVNISADDSGMRQQAVQRTQQWIDYAAALGCPRIMVNQGQPNEVNKPLAIAALKAMSEYGKSKKVMVAMENRGGGGGGRPGAPAPPPPNPAAWVLLVEIMKGAGAYANCDLGNFPDQATQHAGIRGMLPLTDGNCHVKLNPQRYDLPAALKLVKELKYTGLYSIEAGGNMGPDPHQNVQAIYDVLLANI